jgi:hypothetical protein
MRRTIPSLVCVLSFFFQSLGCDMKTYDIFRRDGPGLGPLWMKGEDNLEMAKLEAMRLAAKSNKRHFVLDLSTLTVLYETEVPRTKPPRP